MRTARKITLLTAMTLAAMVMGASSAAAQTEVEVVNEETFAPCNPCAIHLEGESHLTALPAGVEVLKCHDEFLLHIYHNGVGELEWVGRTHAVSGPGCNTINCTTGGEGHWSLSGLSELGNGTEQGVVRFCLRTTADLHCNLPVQISEPGTHIYQLSTNTLCAGGARRLEGTWTTEHDPAQSDEEMELVHHEN